MPRRHAILGIGLVVLTVIAAAAAWRLWRQQQITSAVIAGVALRPDTSRWPADFSQRLETEEMAIRRGDRPIAALGRLVSLYFANGFAAEAAQALATLRQLEPANPRWGYLVADLRLRVADNAGAETVLREVARLDPTYAPAWIRRGDLLVERAAFTEAEQCYLAATKAAPGDARATFALISFEAYHGKRGDPRKELNQLAAAHPGIKPVHEMLAAMNEAAGDSLAATQQRRLASVSRRYVPLDDPWIDGLYTDCFDPNRLSLLAGKMEREGRYPEAVARLERAIRLAPAEPALRNSLAQVRIVEGKPEEAVQVLRRAVTDCPHDPALRERLAMLLRTGKRYDEAAAVVHDALGRWPGRATLYTALGQTLREAGHMEQAFAALRTALQLDSTQPEAWYALGYCQLAGGHRPEARAALAKALEIRPDYPEALLLQAGMAIEEADVATAEPVIDHLMVLRAGDPDVLLLFAALHLIKGVNARKAGNLAEAETLFRAGLGVFPDFAPLLREAGLLARRLGRPDEARQWFEKGARAAEAAGNQAQAAEFKSYLAQPAGG